MAVCVFEKPHNRLVSTCQNFDHKLYQCKTYEEVFTREGGNEVVFCLDRQAIYELQQPVSLLHEFVHPKNATYVFGNNTGMKMAAGIKKLKDKVYKCLTITAPKTNVFWAEQAMPIILYDRWMKHEVGLA